MNNLANFNQTPNQQNQTSSSQNQHNNNPSGIQPNPGVQNNYLQNNYLQQQQQPHNPTQVPRPQNPNQVHPPPHPPPFQHHPPPPPQRQAAPPMQAVFQPNFNPQIGSTQNPVQPANAAAATSQLNPSPIYNPAAAQTTQNLPTQNFSNLQNVQNAQQPQQHRNLHNPNYFQPQQTTVPQQGHQQQPPNTYDRIEI